MTEHTPTPWHISESNATKHGDADASLTIMGKVNDHPWGVATVTVARAKDAEMQSANAAYIIRAVNAHEEMLAILQTIHHYFKNDKHVSPSALTGEYANPITLKKAVEQAIAKAEGE